MHQPTMLSSIRIFLSLGDIQITLVRRNAPGSEYATRRWIRFDDAILESSLFAKMALDDLMTTF